MKADVKGNDFPVVEIIVTGVVAFAIAGIVGGFAAWKSKEIDHATETAFEATGKFIATHPLKFLLGSFVIVMTLGYGMVLQEPELDPANLWVPTGSVVIEHKEYAVKTWPSEATRTFLLTHGEDNMLSPTALNGLRVDMDAILGFKVEGSDIIDANEGDAKTAAETHFSGTWTFDGRGGTKAKCYRFGKSCGFDSILHVFGYSEQKNVLDTSTPEKIQTYLRTWAAAPKKTVVPGVNVVKNFELEDALGGIVRNGNGDIVSAEVIMTSMFLSEKEADVKAHSSDSSVQLRDAVTSRWEADVVCYIGVEDEHPYSKESCSGPKSGLKYTGFLARSFDDEFGDAINGDISKIVISYVLIIIYLFLNLGKRDKVHSMIAQSGGTLIVIGAAYVGSNGFGGLCGVKTNPLNNNIPFLLLGLGVDDAFVIVSEFVRHSVTDPTRPIPERIGFAARTGGMSVLVTSLTDALAFLVGSTTKLPALSGFCLYAGLAIVACFICMFTVFIPLLVLNARRAEANRYDCLCCFKSKVEHKLNEPQGCFACIPACTKFEPQEAIMVKGFRKFGDIFIKNRIGRISTVVLYSIVFFVGLSGLFQLKKDFKPEWFFPEGSYVNEFIDMNKKYFTRGEDFTVYANEVDMYAKQQELADIHAYIAYQDFIMEGSLREDWFSEFMMNKAVYTDQATFWGDLWAWLNTSGKGKYKSKLQWTDPACGGATCTDAQKQQGIAHAIMSRATLREMEIGNDRYEVYRTMREDIGLAYGDDGVAKIFPYSQQFLYWEVLGVIDSELIRNLLITFAIIFVIIALLIPQPRIFTIVAVNIIAAIVEVIGFSHYFGVTMNGISTIYFLVCAGLAVDYSAHIAHTFKDCNGTSQERALDAVIRIGPSVWNAVFSTLMAVAVLGFSKTFVFEVFFKVLFLVSLIAGSHGIWLLPVVLSMIGGSKPSETAKVEPEDKCEGTS